MFLSFNQKGEIEGWEEEFIFFSKECLKEREIKSNIWLEHIHKNDIHFFQNVLNHQDKRHISDLITLYRIRTKEGYIYCFHITYSLNIFKEDKKKRKRIVLLLYIHYVTNTYVMKENHQNTFLIYLIYLPKRA